MHRKIITLLVVFFAASCFSISLSASTLLPVGYISFDASSIRNDSTFDILNESGPNALPPDFPVITPVTISSVSLIVDFQSGQVITESEAAGNFVPDGAGGFTGTFSFNPSFPITSATLTGNLEPGTISDGVTTVTIYPTFSAIVLPSSGTTLQIGDLALINATQTPEPSSWALLGLGLAALFFFRKTQVSLKLRAPARSLGFLVCVASAAWGQVKLNASAQPSTGHAGVTVENLTGSGFPSGAIAPANVTVSLATSCNSNAAATTNASNVATVVGSTRRVSFSIPSSLAAGSYSVSVSGATSAGTAFNTVSCSSLTVQTSNAFLQSAGGALTLNGVPFRFGGGNTYELMYTAQSGVDQALQTAVNNNFKVIRTWGWFDIGNADGTNSIRPPQNGVYFQYWNGSAPAYNDGATGLEKLDYEIYKAGQLGLKLIIPFTNNWIDFGGMDQYVKWAGDQYHDQFYTDLTIRQWYKNWIAHVLNRVNTFSGIAYRDDPTIIIWELANEPRCQGSGSSAGGYPSSNTCNSQTIVSWIDDVAPYIKTIDSNHLVSVGDEGFYCNNTSSSDVTQNCGTGVNTIAFTEAQGIDLMGFHLYPENWGQSTAGSEQYIDQHLSDAHNLGKPVYLGEFGLLSGNTRNTIYHDWTDRVLNEGGSGALFWDLTVGQPGASAAEATGSLDVYDGGPLLTTIDNFAQMMTGNTELPFPPVADDSWATSPFNQASTLSPLQNDVAYAGATIDPNSIDLDPNTPGQQTSVTVYGGQFSVTGQNVVFTPNAGFNGTTQGTYTMEDSNHHLSNVAYLNVTVNPSQAGSLNIESFETGTDGWAPINGSSAGSVAQSTMFATDGTHSLQVTLNAGGTGWVGVSFANHLNLTGRPSLSIDVQTTGMGGSVGLAFQSGSNYQWCQTQDPWPTVQTNSLNTLTIPLDASHINCLNGGTPDLTNIESFFVYLSGPGTYYLDYLRAAPSTNTGGAVSLFSFESGTQGWGPVNNNGSVQQTTAFHTDGNYGLQLNVTAGNGWMGGSVPATADLTGKTTLSVDLETTTTGTSTEISVQSGPQYTWCQGTAFPYVNSGAATTITINLDQSKLSCSGGDGQFHIDQVHSVNVYVGSVGSYYIDNVRAQ